ncbi:MAG: Gfo/Idh/MocA family oxidoreductase [Proteobacteria bacterium]|nr:Gfo/Idh/MocA family oxidoreductase [Pseudomonadota bacterium]
MLTDEDINTVFIATRHNLHAEYVLKAMKAGKNVFVEKPLTMTIEELEEIRETYEARSGKCETGNVKRVKSAVDF